MKWGGKNLSTAQLANVFEYAGRYALDLRDVVGAGHARLLMQSQKPEVLEVVKKVARGEAYVAIAITEESAGSDLHAMKSTSKKVKGGFVLTGSKLFNARLLNATHVIIFTQAHQSKGRLNSFIVPLNHPGLHIVTLEAPGLHGNSFGGLNFDQMFVPSEMAIGENAQGGQVFRQHFLYWRLMMAAAAVGTGQQALEQVVERMRTREVFGAAIGRFTHLQQALAEHTSKLHMAHLLIKDAAHKIDEGRVDDATPLVAMAKAEGVEIALAAADFAMKTFGAEGYSNKVDLGQRVIDLMGLRIADGTTDVLRSEVVRKVYGNDFWDMAIKGRVAGSALKMPAMAMFSPESALKMPAMATFSPAGGSNPIVEEVSPWLDRELVISKLQETQLRTSQALAVQGTFDPLIRAGGGGACATTTAFNLLQIIRSYELPDFLLNPQAVIADAFLQIPELLNGRVTNQQFIDLMNYFKKYLVDLDFQVSIKSVSQDLKELDLPKANEIQVYIFRVYKNEGSFVGRHFVVLKKKENHLIVVQDPQNPIKNYEYLLQPTPATEIDKGPIHLVRPGSLVSSKDYGFYLESVATIEMK